ncbi:hypothetical protein WDU94_015369 [Cyamophila willieti]
MARKISVDTTLLLADAASNVQEHRKHSPRSGRSSFNEGNYISGVGEVRERDKTEMEQSGGGAGVRKSALYSILKGTKDGRAGEEDTKGGDRRKSHLEADQEEGEGEVKGESEASDSSIYTTASDRTTSRFTSCSDIPNIEITGPESGKVSESGEVYVFGDSLTIHSGDDLSTDPSLIMLSSDDSSVECIVIFVFVPHAGPESGKVSESGEVYVFGDSLTIHSGDDLSTDPSLIMLSSDDSSVECIVIFVFVPHAGHESGKVSESGEVYVFGDSLTIHSGDDLSTDPSLIMLSSDDSSVECIVIFVFVPHAGPESGKVSESGEVYVFGDSLTIHSGDDLSTDPSLIMLSSDDSSVESDSDVAVATDDLSDLSPELLLYRASTVHNLPVMCHALALGVNKEWTNPHDYNRTYLHQAVISNSVMACEYLILNGMKLNHADTEGRTPLYLATELGHTGQVCLLLKHKADQHIADVRGLEPLTLAVEKANADIVTLLRLED